MSLLFQKKQEKVRVPQRSCFTECCLKNSPSWFELESFLPRIGERISSVPDFINFFSSSAGIKSSESKKVPAQQLRVEVESHSSFGLSIRLHSSLPLLPQQLDCKGSSFNQIALPCSIVCLIHLSYRRGKEEMNRKRRERSSFTE